MSLHKRLIKFQFLIDHKSFTERVGILAGLLLVILLPWYFLIYSPQAETAEQMQQQIDTLNAQTLLLQRKYDNILTLVKNQDTARLMARYQTLQQQMTKLNQEITQFHHRYISDKNLAKLLYALLEDMDNVKIQNFSSVKKVPKLVEPPPKNDKTPPPAKSGAPAAAPVSESKSPDIAYYSLSLRGDFLSILRYMQRIENLKWQIFWTKIDYQVGTYPDAIATIEFYTLRPALILVTPEKQKE